MSSITNCPINHEKFAKWLKNDAEINEWRRIVRIDDENILISKFKEDFAQNLHKSIALIPELLDLKIIQMQYQNLAITNKNAQRTKNWYQAINSIVNSSQYQAELGKKRVAEILAGIDSVYSILETILWTSPKVFDAYKPHAGEIIAYKDMLKSMVDNQDIFTKYYGNYEDRKVVNHCPGATIAKKMLTHAWKVCTTTNLK